MTSPEKRLLVVLDTNVWDFHTLLRSHLAASMILLVERLGGRIVVPEVVKTEVESHLVAEYAKKLDEFQGALSRIAMILGRSPDPDFDDASAASEALNNRLAELGTLIEVAAFKDRHFVEAGRMVLAGKAPNSVKSQQYKDCLLWRAVVDLHAGNSEVIFVTSDGGFYGSADGRDLHPDLQTDLPDEAGVVVLRSLQDLVGHLQPQAPELDFAPLAVSVNDWLRPQLQDLSSRQLDGARLGVLIGEEFEAFVTGKPAEAVVRYRIEHELNFLDNGKMIAGIARSSGEVTATLTPPAVVEFGLDSIDFVATGEEVRGGLIIVRGGTAVSGGRVREHGVRTSVPT